MTNKINGIDVSECPLYDKKTGCYHTFNGECVKDSCAVYKWLSEYKRLQQENKDLKAKVKNYKLYGSSTVVQPCNHTNTEYDLLVLENEKLKANKGRCAFKSLDNTFCGEAKIQIDKLKLDKDCLNASLETARKYRGIAETDRDKYKQALEEIREKCLKMCNICDNIDGETYLDDCNSICEYCKIIKLINEVLNDRD